MRVRFRPDAGRQKNGWRNRYPVDAVVTSVPDIRMSQIESDVDTLCSRNPGNGIYICNRL